MVSVSASAGKAARLGKKLKSEDARIRLSAVLALGNSSDKAALRYVASALSDSDAKVRAAAAASAERLLRRKQSKKLKSKVIATLKKMSTSDPDRMVRKQAKAAITEKHFPKGGTYIHLTKIATNSWPHYVGPAADQSLRKALIESGRGLYPDWPTGKAPSKKQLQKLNAKAYAIGGGVSGYSAEPGGIGTVITCNLSMHIATYPKMSIKATASGGGSVEAGSSESEIKQASIECVEAIATHLMKNKLIPGVGVLSQ